MTKIVRQKMKEKLLEAPCASSDTRNTGPNRRRRVSEPTAIGKIIPEVIANIKRQKTA